MCDAAARAKFIEIEGDARIRLIKRLEAIAYADPRDIVQWDRKPVFGKDGSIKGYRTELMVTPSHLLTRQQVAVVKSVTTKSGGVRFEMNDQLTALAQLARLLGLTQPDAPPLGTKVNVGQVNVVKLEDNPFEFARRLQFALELASRGLARADKTLDSGQSNAPKLDSRSNKSDIQSNESDHGDPLFRGRETGSARH